jgi:hypothetical protein
MVDAAFRILRKHLNKCGLAWHAKFAFTGRRMKTSFPWKQTLVLFAGVLLAYLAVFNGIEWARHRKGPWKVDFMTDAQGHPSIGVFQEYLKVSAKLHFPEESVGRTNFGTRVAFDRPKHPVPFGKVIYEDLTFLPGVVTFDLFGHEVELLPRVLIINKREISWTEARLELFRTNKLSTAPKPAKGYD